jgi:hypothetical protein
MQSGYVGLNGDQWRLQQPSPVPGTLVHEFQNRAILGFSIPHLKLAATVASVNDAVVDAALHGTQPTTPEP